MVLLNLLSFKIFLGMLRKSYYVCCVRLYCSPLKYLKGDDVMISKQSRSFHCVSIFWPFLLTYQQQTSYANQILWVANPHQKLYIHRKICLSESLSVSVPEKNYGTRKCCKTELLGKDVLFLVTVSQNSKSRINEGRM